MADLTHSRGHQRRFCTVHASGAGTVKYRPKAESKSRCLCAHGRPRHAGSGLARCVETMNSVCTAGGRNSLGERSHYTVLARIYCGWEERLFSQLYDPLSIAKARPVAGRTCLRCPPHLRQKPAPQSIHQQPSRPQGGRPTRDAGYSGEKAGCAGS